MSKISCESKSKKSVRQVCVAEAKRLTKIAIKKNYQTIVKDTLAMNKSIKNLEAQIKKDTNKTISEKHKRELSSMKSLVKYFMSKKGKAEIEKKTYKIVLKRCMDKCGESKSLFSYFF